MRRVLMLALVSVVCSPVWATNDEEPVEAFDRGIGRPTSLFVPKGTICTGLSVSYSNNQFGNGIDDAGYKMMFSMIDNLHGGLQSFGIAPSISYFIRDNLSLGLRFDYDKTGFNLGALDLALGDLMTMNISDMNYLKQSYSGSVTLRTYMPIAESKRFAMFAELRGTGAYAQSESYKTEDGKKYGTYQDIYQGALSVVPGICCFVSNEAALEVSVGVLGFTHQKTVQTTNQVEVSQKVQDNASFKINLLSINMGVYIYLQTGKNKKK